MVYVTHDQVEAMTMADKIVVMKDGLIQQIGSPLTLYNDPDNLFVAGFIGSPPMNFMPVTIKKDGVKMIADEGEFRIEVPAEKQKLLENHIDKSVMMGVRPENLKVNETGSKDNSITARIQVIEQLGEEIQLHLKTDMSSIIAKVPPNLTFSVDEEIFFAPAPDKIYFFEKDSENVIK